MSITISNPSAHGTATTVIAEQPVRAPLAGNIPWTRPDAPAVGSLPLGFNAQVVTVPNDLVAAVGGEMNRR
jgi:hypothetical protein